MSIPPEKVPFYAEQAYTRSYLLIQNYLENFLPARHDALLRTFQEVRPRFDQNGRLNPRDALLWVYGVADAMVLLSDLAAVILATRGPLKNFGTRMIRATSSQIRGVFQSIREKTTETDAERLWAFEKLKQVVRDNPGLSQLEIEVLHAVRDGLMRETSKTFRAIARLFLRHEELFHRIKHSPWSIVTNLQETAGGHQVVSVLLDESLWESGRGGSMFIPVSIPVWNVWARALEEANYLLQTALQNHRFRIEMADLNGLPVMISCVGEETGKEYKRIAEQLIKDKKRAEITVKLQLSGQQLPGGWLDNQETLWARLSGPNWPDDAQFQ